MPSSGSRAFQGLENRRAPGGVERGRGAEVADARNDEPLGRGQFGGIAGVQNRGPHRAERLAHRGQVAGAVVDERDHNSSLVLGSIFARRASLAHATLSARPNALKHASIL